ncbi:MAG: co-chaperone GroES [Candidatus Magasanikbacteria bacterium]|nr:co-chaperone GroES [Candidatus Magasanikbacteria bacterium]
MNIKPLGDRALIKPDREEEVTASGIVLPDTVDKEKKAWGTIMALGGGEELKKLGLKTGDRVVFEKWGGEEVKVGKGKDEVEYKILPHDKILAVME